MTCYCTLFLRSNRSEIPLGVLQEVMLDDLSLEDYQSAANLARAERLRKNNGGWGFVQREDLPRYCWTVNSREKIDGDDLYEHVLWLVSGLQPGFSLKNLSTMGFEYGITVYWGGGGTGGGPLVTPRLSELLVLHNVNLDIGFYFESTDVHD